MASLKSIMTRMEVILLKHYYIEFKGNIAAIARKLEVDRSHLHQKLERYGIHSPKKKG